MSKLIRKILSQNPKRFAKHLRQPSGLFGRLVGHLLNEVNEFINRSTIEQMNIQENDQILEIGFGNGMFIKEMADKAKRGFVAGIDISDIMVKQAIKKNKHLISQGKVEIKKASLERIPFDDARFHKVCTINTLYYWPDPEKSIKEIYRVLKKEGHVYISIRTREALEKMKFSKYGFTLYELEDVNRLLRGAGFRNLRHKHEQDKKNLDALYVIAQK
jgi:ubiquinone/menaquinone biosynthesis C-methylase UbiE